MSSIPIVTLFYPSVPTIPRDLHALVVSNSEVDLTWRPPTSDGGTTITYYAIEIVHLDTKLNFTTEKISFRVSNLRKGEHYQISVKAVNAIGASFSVNTSATTFDGKFLIVSHHI